MKEDFQFVKMSRQNSSALWDYFTKIENSNKRAMCRLCHESYSYSGSSGNLKAHIRKKHFEVYDELVAAQESMKQHNGSAAEEKVTYEYVVEAASPSSSISNEPPRVTFIDTSAAKELQATKRTIESIRSSISEKHRKIARENISKETEKRLIEKLTEEKISVAILQKQLIEKEVEEKNLKVLLLKEEMAHKRQIYEQEKSDIEHKQLMNELQRNAMCLKIEILKANLASAKKDSGETEPS